MSAFSSKFLFFGLVRYRLFHSLCLFSVAFALSIFPVNAEVVTSPVSDLQSVFGEPQVFADKFENVIKDKSDAIVGLLLAGSGFVYALRIFTH